MKKKLNSMILALIIAALAISPVYAGTVKVSWGAGSLVASGFLAGFGNTEDVTVRLYAEGTLPSCDDKFVSGTDEAQRIGNGKLDDLVLEATAEHCPDPDAVDWYYANITVFETNDEKNVLWFREYDCTTNLMTNPVTVDCRARK